MSGTPRHRPRVRPAPQSQTLVQPRPRSQPGPSPSRSGAAAQLPHVTDGDRPELYRGYNNREEVQHLWLEPQEETEQNSHSQKVKRKHRWEPDRSVRVPQPGLTSAVHCIGYMKCLGLPHDQLLVGVLYYQCTCTMHTLHLHFPYEIIL